MIIYEHITLYKVRLRKPLKYSNSSSIIKLFRIRTIVL